ncbi:hypothetical protein [Vibrio sp.]
MLKHRTTTCMRLNLHLADQLKIITTGGDSYEAGANGGMMQTTY